MCASKGFSFRLFFFRIFSSLPPLSRSQLGFRVSPCALSFDITLIRVRHNRTRKQRERERGDYHQSIDRSIMLFRSALCRHLRRCDSSSRRGFVGFCSPTSMTREQQKTTTGLVGLPVLNDPIASYAKLCDQVLDAIKFVPDHAAYRTIVTQTYEHRKSVTLSGKTVPEIEETIAAGQIEELAMQARDELDLIPKMREWKPWEFEHEIEIEKEENPTGIEKN